MHIFIESNKVIRGKNSRSSDGGGRLTFENFYGHRHTPGNMTTVVANPEIFYTFFVSVFFLKSERSHSISSEMILYRYLCKYIYPSFRLVTYFYGIWVKYYVQFSDRYYYIISYYRIFSIVFVREKFCTSR